MRPFLGGRFSFCGPAETTPLRVDRVLELFAQERFKGLQAGLNGFRGGKVRGDGVGGLQAVTRDADNSSFLFADAALLDQLSGNAGGYAARGLSENTLGFGEQLDRVDDFRIRDVLGPAP